MGVRNNEKISDRLFRYSQAVADNSLDGRSGELPKKDIQAALNATQLLIPPPSTSALGLVKEGQGGTYFEDLELFDAVLVEGPQTTIVSSGLVGVKAASFCSFNPKVLVNNTNNAVVLLIEDVESFGTVLGSIIVGGDNATGIRITGENNKLFISPSQIEMRGVGCTGLDITGSSASPIDTNFNTVGFGANGQTFLNYNPPSQLDVIDINISSIFNTDAVIPLPTTFTGTRFANIQSGNVKVRGGSVDAVIYADVGGTGVMSVSQDAIAGRVTVVDDGIVVMDTVGVIFGDLETADQGSLQVRSTNIFGSVDHQSTNRMTIKCDGLFGNLNLDGPAFVNIDILFGTLTFTVEPDGFINGVKYGKYRKQLMLRAVSLVEQSPTILDIVEQVEFGAAQGSGSDPVSIDVDGEVTFNKGGQYENIFNFQLGRVGAGNVSWIFLRFKLDGVQFDEPILTKLNDINDDLHMEVTKNLTVTAGQTMTVEMIRDSQGNNTGKLMTETPILSGWGMTPSAALTISRP